MAKPDHAEQDHQEANAEHPVKIAGEHAHPASPRRGVVAATGPADRTAGRARCRGGVGHPGRRAQEHHERDHGEDAERHPQGEPGGDLVVVGQGFAHLQDLVEGDQHRQSHDQAVGPLATNPIDRQRDRHQRQHRQREDAHQAAHQLRLRSPRDRPRPADCPSPPIARSSVISRSSSPRGRKSASGLASLVSNSRKRITTSPEDCPASAASRCGTSCCRPSWSLSTIGSVGPVRSACPRAAVIVTDSRCARPGRGTPPPSAICRRRSSRPCRSCHPAW